ncbi:MAG TPA: hypothetical protein VGR74_07105 [Actinomycetota bacterium]|jgi:hypothetical protein|nr:hypothetical protein [Actinomycetota bacterium]
MPPEQDETRTRQIEALRQYINQLSEQRDRPKVEVGMRLPDLVSERRRRPPLSWLLVTVALVVAALVGGVFVGAAAWSDDRPARAPAGGGGSTTQAPGGVPLVATPECKTAVDRANEVLAVAVRMRRAVAERTTVASGEPARFDQALAGYRQVVDQCRLRTP